MNFDELLKKLRRNQNFKLKTNITTKRGGYINTKKQRKRKQRKRQTRKRN